MSTRRVGGALAAILLAGSCLALASAPRANAAPPSKTDDLRAGFTSPPNSARPRVWWHWMNGNITKDGIRKDMEWMSRVGIGGLQNFDASLLTPQIVPHRLVYMSPDWRDAFHYAASLADQLGLELGIASSPGWSETGGPWVKPQDAMKKLVWSEVDVAGGQPFSGRLPAPPHTTGPFQDVPEAGDILGPPDPNKPTLYADALVIAYKLPAEASDLPMPRVTTGAGAPLDAKPLTDKSLQTGVLAPRGSDSEPGSVIVEYPSPQTVRSLTLAFNPPTDALGQGGTGLRPRLEADDGAGWKPVAEVPLEGASQSTVSFPAVTARRFRILFTPAAPVKPFISGGAPGADMSILAVLRKPTPAMVDVRQLRFSSEARVNRFELKAGFGVAPDYYALDHGVPEARGVAPEDVIDLTGKLGPDGRLDWTPPPGRWKVLRLGYSLVGATNHPATKEATGLEADKLDGAAVRRDLETYLGMYTEVTGPDLIGKRGVRALVTDSIESGPANWTPAILTDFQKLRGYDARPWLPALTGVLVGDQARSDGFLYDWRRTLADLIADQHYGTVAKIAHEHGLTLYGEALEDRRPMLGDDLAMRSHTDVPMSALWSYAASAGPSPTYLGDMKGAASVAHVYGQNLVAAESMTSAMWPWAFAPHDLKKFIDLEFASGVNRPVIHTSVHQPLDKPPGLSLLIFGQYFTRLETWAEMAGPWVDYMARNAFLLQQGRNVADVAYFIGEEGPITELYAEGALKDLPKAYAFDFVNADMVISQLRPEGADLATPGGARYRAIYLGGTSGRMTLPVLRRLAALADAGATVIGLAPKGSPSLADDPAAFAALVHRLWGGGEETAVGRGRVVASQDLEGSLRKLGIAPDFTYEGGPTDREILFVHRRLSDGDTYYVDNRKDRPERVEAHFRVTGKTPEIWRADTGRSEPISYRIENGETAVPLEMAPYDSFFVVFRKPAKARMASFVKPAWAPALTIQGPWQVTFQPERGAPPSTRFSALAPLNVNANPGIKYFSGTASYRTTFRLPGRIRAGQPLVLDLGAVGDIAQVSVNGAPVGTAWKAPFRVDVSKAVRRGVNTLEVRVADLWVNRLIGDKQPGAQKVTFTVAPTYLPDAPLRPAGLIGPVELLTAR